MLIVSFPMVFLWDLPSFFTGVITILGTIGFMMSISVKISLIVILLTPVSLFVASFIAGRALRCLKSSLRSGLR